jgi:hypothetical protein
VQFIKTPVKYREIEFISTDAQTDRSYEILALNNRYTMESKYKAGHRFALI